MKTFSVVLNKESGQRELKENYVPYIGRVGAVLTSKELKSSPTVSIGDVLYCPLTKFNWEVVVIK